MKKLIFNKDSDIEKGDYSVRYRRGKALKDDVIREYEYQVYGQTRLFTLPYKGRQNSNGDICVVNGRSKSADGLVILSLFGSVKRDDRGQRLRKI